MEKMTEMADMMTVTDAAEIIGVTPRCVRGWIKSKKIKAYHVNDRMYLIKKTEAEKAAKMPRSAAGRKKISEE